MKKPTSAGKSATLYSIHCFQTITPGKWEWMGWLFPEADPSHRAVSARFAMSIRAFTVRPEPGINWESCFCFSENL